MESVLPIAADHPAYPGHFPGNPILPGVVVLAEVLAAVAAWSGRPASAWSVASTKFLFPVTPGTAITLSCDETSSGLRFRVSAGNRTIATGTLVARA